MKQSVTKIGHYKLAETRGLQKQLKVETGQRYSKQETLAKHIQASIRMEGILHLILQLNLASTNKDLRILQILTVS